MIGIINDNRIREQHIESSFRLATDFLTDESWVSTVLAGSNGSGRNEIRQYLEELASRGGGELIPSGSSMTANLLLAIL